MTVRTRSVVLLAALLVVLIAFGLRPAWAADDVEGVKEKLFQAKKAYDAETQKFHKSVSEVLDKRETDARKAGNKKLVDQAKGDRDRFEKTGELPTDCPKAALAQITTARTKLDKAYGAAVKDLTKLKEDTTAETTEKEQQKFQLDSALLFGKRTYLVSLKYSEVKVRENWFRIDGTTEGKKLVKLNGEPAPHSIYMVPPHRGFSQVKYAPGPKMVAFRTQVGVPKFEDTTQDPDSALTFEVFGDDRSLWTSKPVTKVDEFQTCELNIEKVKVLTLKIHCAASSNWARACWLEPILME